MIIGISGKQGVGKDTLARLIVSATGGVYEVAHFAAPLYKDICDVWPCEADYVTENKAKFRGLLQELGKARRVLQPDYFIRNFIARFDRAANVVVADIRRREDILALEAAFPSKCIFVRLTADKKIRRERGRQLPHAEDITETALDDYDAWACVVDNNGSLPALKRAAEEIHVLASVKQSQCAQKKEKKEDGALPGMRAKQR